MADAFETVVTRLWVRFGVPAPAIDSQRVAMLSVDGNNLTIGESPDGQHVVVYGAVGPLATDALRRSAQVRRILQDNLGLLLNNRAGVRLRPGDGAPVVEAHAIGDCNPNRMDLLVGLIEDVLQLIEFHGASLTDISNARGQKSAPMESGVQQSLIFRP